MIHDHTFYNVLFDPNEQTCFASDLKYIGVRPVEIGPFPGDQFFCINPLQYTRKDSNVTAYRNILVEFDHGSVEEQRNLINSSELPCSTLVWSGNKSYHAIISLQESLKSKEDYVRVAKSIYAKLGGEPIVDTKTSNPSRFSRTPEVNRLDNGNRQTLLHVGERIPNKVLFDWLGLHLFQETYNTPKKMPFENKKRLLPVKVLAFLKYGADTGSRNATLFANACEMFRAGYDEFEIFEKVSEVLDLPEWEVKRTIGSAKKAVQEE